MAQNEAAPNDRASADLGEVAGRGESLGLDAEQLRSLRAEVAAWREGPVAKAYARVPPRAEELTTWSGLEVIDLATPVDKLVDYRRDLGLPGAYPFTRGVQPTMYRGRLWTMRMFAGFGTAGQTNERFKYLYEQGQTGFSTAFDFPTLMGYDSDSPLALGRSASAASPSIRSGTWRCCSRGCRSTRSPCR